MFPWTYQQLAQSDFKQAVMLPVWQGDRLTGRRSNTGSPSPSDGSACQAISCFKLPSLASSHRLHAALVTRRGGQSGGRVLGGGAPWRWVGSDSLVSTRGAKECSLVEDAPWDPGHSWEGRTHPSPPSYWLILAPTGSPLVLAMFATWLLFAWMAS